MKIIYLCLLLLVSGFNSFGQNIIDNILNIKIDSIAKVDVEQNGYFIYIPSTFAQSKIKGTDQIKFLKDKTVLSINLVYSAYKESIDFDQKKLNQRRLNQFKKHARFLFDNNRIVWKQTCQLEGNTLAESKKLFHGYQIKYLPAPSAEESRKEIQSIKTILENAKAHNAYLDSLSALEVIDSSKIIIKSRWDDKIGFVADTMYGDFYEVKKVVAPVALPDTTVKSVLERNQWNNMIIVSDVTASMNTYTSQLLLWYQNWIDTRRIKSFLFFNDGNTKPNALKRIGTTGGIYYVNAETQESVLKIMENTMLRGHGGDAVENDVEAILRALEYAKNMDEIILIADNKSDMRDFDLMFNIQRPVRVIICGNPNAINPQYLMLARATKGSVHTSTHDIYNLNQYFNGEKFKIGDAMYSFEKGMFKAIYSSN